MRTALDYKLLEENSIKGAKGALINVTGGMNMPLGEIEDAIGMIEEEADDDADIIWGNVIKEGMDDEIKDHGHRHRIRCQGPVGDASAQDDRDRDRRCEARSRCPAGMPPGGRLRKEENMDVPTFIRRQAD